MKDLAEISEDVKKALEIIPASRMEEVLEVALVRKPEAIVWQEDTESAKQSSAQSQPGTRLTAH